jgi:hypothetical protein
MTRRKKLASNLLAFLCLYSASAEARPTKTVEDPETGNRYTLVQVERGDTQGKLAREYRLSSLAELDRFNGGRLGDRRPTNPKAKTTLSGYNLLWVGEWITVKTTDLNPPAVWSFINQRPDHMATREEQMARMGLVGSRIDPTTEEHRNLPAGTVVLSVTFKDEVWGRTLLTQGLNITTWVVKADTVGDIVDQMLYGRFEVCGNGALLRRDILKPLVVTEKPPPDLVIEVDKPDTVTFEYTQRTLWESDLSVGGGAVGSESYRKGEQFATGTLSQALIAQWLWANMKVDWNRSSDYSFIHGGQTTGMWSNLDSRFRLGGGLRLNTPGGSWNVRAGLGPEWINGDYGGFYYEVEPDLHLWRFHFHPLVGVSPWANFQQQMLRAEFDLTRNWPAKAASLRLVTEARVYTEPGLDPWNSEWGQVHGGVGLGLWNRRGRPSGLYVMVGDSPYGPYLRTGLYVRTAHDTYDPPWKGTQTVERIYPAQRGVAAVETPQPPELASVTFEVDIRRWVAEGKIKEGDDLWYALKLWSDFPDKEWEHVYVAGGPVGDLKEGEPYPLSWEEDIFKKTETELKLNGDGIYRVTVPDFPVGQQVQYRFVVDTTDREDLIWTLDYDAPHGGFKNKNSVRVVTPSVSRAPEQGL